jgi:hypothetical protein
LSTAMQLRAKRFGSMPIPFRSIKILFLISMRTSSGIRRVPRVREPFWHFRVHIAE